MHDVWVLDQILLGKKLYTIEKQMYDSQRLPNNGETVQNTALEFVLHIVFSCKDMQK